MPAKKLTAFTLVETLAAMGIIAILVVIIAPVMMKAKEKAGETNCVSNLQSLHKSIALYRTEYDGDGVYGPASAMGLPFSTGTVVDLPGARSYHCNGTPNQIIPSDKGFPYFYRAAEKDRTLPLWEDYVQQYGDASVVVVDFNHNPKDLPMISPYVTKYALGVTLGGNVVRQRKDGDEVARDWWNEK